MSVFNFNDVASREWPAGGDGECTAWCQHEDVCISGSEVNARGCAGQHTVKHGAGETGGVGAAVVQHILAVVACCRAGDLRSKRLPQPTKAAGGKVASVAVKRIKFSMCVNWGGGGHSTRCNRSKVNR